MKQKVEASFTIQNTDRTVGTLLGSEVTKRYGRERAAGRHNCSQF